jgi:hypothetical protein
MAKEKKVKKVAVLHVQSKRAGFRRAGFQFGAEPVNIPVADLSKEQVEALTSEPMLIVVRAEIDVDDTSEEVAA